MAALFYFYLTRYLTPSALFDGWSKKKKNFFPPASDKHLRQRQKINAQGDTKKDGQANVNESDTYRQRVCISVLVTLIMFISCPSCKCEYEDHSGEMFGVRPSAVGNDKCLTATRSSDVDGGIQ